MYYEGSDTSCNSKIYLRGIERLHVRFCQDSRYVPRAALTGIAAPGFGLKGSGAMDENQASLSRWTKIKRVEPLDDQARLAG